MRASKNNHLFISASVSLILIAFFIVIESDKTDVLFHPEKLELKKEDTKCKGILTGGLSLAIKTTDEAIAAMNSDNTTLENILELDSIVALKNARNCLGRSPLEVNLDEFSKNISFQNDPFSNLRAINKIALLLENTLGSSTTFKNIDLKVVTNISLTKDDDKS